jgi:hypothetical protein
VFNQSTNLDVSCQIYVRDDTSFTCLPSEKYLNAIRKMLDETDRSHKKTLLIRGITQRGAVKTYATWDSELKSMTLR